MTPKEAAAQQWKALKEKTLKEKIRHIFTYYKIPILAVLLVVVLAVSLSLQLKSVKNTVLHIVCLDTAAEKTDAKAFLTDLSLAVGIDRETEQIIISTDIALQGEAYDGEVLAAQIMGGVIDVLALRESEVLQWLYQDVFADLSETLTAAQQEAYKGWFLYVDGAVLEKMDNASEVVSFPDPTKPEDMEKPIPIAIRIPESTEFSGVYFPALEESVIIGVLANAPNVSNTLSFIDYLMR